MKVDKRLVFFVSILVFASVFVFAAYSNPPAVWHDSNETDFKFVVDGTVGGELTLQQAIDSNHRRLFVRPDNIRVLPDSVLDGEHSIDEIYVNVSGSANTLDDALKTKKSLCPCAVEGCNGEDLSDFASISYDKTQIAFGHSAEDIMINISDIEDGAGYVTGEMSLQDAINDGFFCSNWVRWKPCNTERCFLQERRDASNNDCIRVADGKILNDNRCSEVANWRECHNDDDSRCYVNGNVNGRLCSDDTNPSGSMNCDSHSGCHSSVCNVDGVNGRGDWAFWGDCWSPVVDSWATDSTYTCGVCLGSNPPAHCSV